ncbi:MAG: TonB-dependent receptor [Bacteroidetes Order II. Incertae sedis bacterium]|nr:TonB-dependent receptor [Bacteroidetes Order II. bacterium]
MYRYFLCFLFLLPFTAMAQRPKQTLKGVVIDKTTRHPLTGATITLPESKPLKGTTSGADGRFRLEGVAVGVYTVRIQFIGYAEVILNRIEVTSAKETEMTVEMTELNTELAGTTIIASRKNDPLNEMSVVSARSFSVEETKRYAATINDPSRLVAGYPGVTNTQDNNNDIVVRGNTSAGVLWRLEGVDIPNPNHFARPGSSGGGISAFSASLLANSDFSSGAFAAEYGNALSAVFDMRFRHGNTEKREYTARIGLIGLEIGVEGPLQRNKSAYLANYRYSTLGILSGMGFNFVSERTSNTFQDLSFLLYFPSQNGKSVTTVFGFGGLSLERHSELKDQSKWKSRGDRQRSDFETNLGVLGVTNTYLLTSKSYLKTTLALMDSFNSIVEDTLNHIRIPAITAHNNARDTRISLASHYSRKVSTFLSLKAGLNASLFRYNLFFDRLVHENWQTAIDSDGLTGQADVYVQTKYHLTSRTAIIAGIHGLWFALNKTSSVEPRIALTSTLSPRQTMTLAYGLHSRILPLGLYFKRNVCPLLQPNCTPYPTLPNTNLPLAKAHHWVVSHNFAPSEQFHVQTEVYYQRLFNVPTLASGLNSYWFFNDMEGFGQTGLAPEGKGRNYGIDLIVERHFVNRFFFLLTGAVFRSFFDLPNGQSFSTQYDSRFTSSYLGGKEFPLRKGGILQVGSRVAWNGGNRYTPPDEAKSAQAGYYVSDESRIFAAQVPNYFRVDGRIAVTKNRNKYNYTVSLDMMNIGSRKNPQWQQFDPQSKEYYFSYQSEFIPVLTWEVDF